MSDRFDRRARPETGGLVEFRPADCMGRLPDDPYDRIRMALACGLAAWPSGIESIGTGVALARRAFRQAQRGTRCRQSGDDQQGVVGP